MSDELKWAAYVMISPPFIILMMSFAVSLMVLDSDLAYKIGAVIMMAYVLFVMCAMIF
jgi:hypothetical protein